MAISHINPGNVILNCAKMRDYVYTQVFCVPHAAVDLDRALLEGAKREIDARQILKETLVTAAKK